MTGSRIARTVTALAAAGALFGAGGAALAHDEIESSVPEHQSQFDEPISEAVINFGAPVDGVELALVGPDNRDLPGTVTKLSDTSARLDFEPLSQQGEYLIRFLAEEDGHLVAGAITFVYGSEGGTGAGVTTWIVFGLAAVAILGVGAYFSLRRARESTDDPTELVAG